MKFDAFVCEFPQKNFFFSIEFLVSHFCKCYTENITKFLLKGLDKKNGFYEGLFFIIP